MCNGTVTLTDTTFASNSAAAGGGMLISKGSEVTLRQCSFISNTASHLRGHAIYTYDYSPTIAVINTYFSDPNRNNNIYVDTSYNGGSPTWKTCSSPNICTEAPFTFCSAVDSNNVKLGVKCTIPQKVRHNIVFTGLNKTQAENNKDVIRDAIASALNVSQSKVTIISIIERTRRRRTTGRALLSTKVTINYEVTVADKAAVKEVETAMTSDKLQTSLVTKWQATGVNNIVVDVTQTPTVVRMPTADQQWIEQQWIEQQWIEQQRIEQQRIRIGGGSGGSSTVNSQPSGSSDEKYGIPNTLVATTIAETLVQQLQLW